MMWLGVQRTRNRPNCSQFVASSLSFPPGSSKSPIAHPPFQRKTHWFTVLYYDLYFKSTSGYSKTKPPITRPPLERNNWLLQAIKHPPNIWFLGLVVIPNRETHQLLGSFQPTITDKPLLGANRCMQFDDDDQSGNSFAHTNFRRFFLHHDSDHSKLLHKTSFCECQINLLGQSQNFKSGKSFPQLEIKRKKPIS